MQIILNGEPKEIDPQTAITELMKQFGYEEGVGAVAVNMTFVPTDKYHQTILKEGDEVEVLAPIYGG